MKTITHLGRTVLKLKSALLLLAGLSLLSFESYGQIPVGTFAPSSEYPTKVIDYTQGSNIPQIPPANVTSRTDSMRALGIPENSDAHGSWNFVTLGFGGSITLAFSDSTNPYALFGWMAPVQNTAGDDIIMWETSFFDPANWPGGFGCADYEERAKVEVSADGIVFHELGTACIEDASFDMDDAGDVWPGGHMNGIPYPPGKLPGAFYVRITDMTPMASRSQDGYDLDGIEAKKMPIGRAVPECSPNKVAYFSQGLNNGGGVIPPLRSNPLNALGTPEKDDTYNFVSLGAGGEIIVKWDGDDNILYDQAFDDFATQETSFKDPACGNYPEYAEVQVSPDSITWYSLGTACTQETRFDFGSTGLLFIKYVRIIDDATPFGSSIVDYHDVDGVECLAVGPVRVANPLSTNQINIEEQLIQMYPNPANANENVNLYVESFEGNAVHLEVFDSFGSLMTSYDGDGLVAESISLSNYAPGMYIIKIEMDGIEETRKLIVR